MFVRHIANIALWVASIYHNSDDRQPRGSTYMVTVMLAALRYVYTNVIGVARAIAISEIQSCITVQKGNKMVN